MKILALEFSPHERSIAVLDDSIVLGFAIDLTSKGTRAFELINCVLTKAQMKPGDVECIAVGLGPGSYGGIRTAISIAQGWQLAHGVKLIGISSADVIARRLFSADGMQLLRRQTPFCGVANIVFDAQRNESYAIRYRIGLEEQPSLGPPGVLTAAEEARRREGGEIFVKADTGPWRLGEEPTLLSDARMAGMIAVSRTNFVSGWELEPIYLRLAEFVKAPAPKFLAT
ncbi:MAG TPA: tRNA (adenosine(37)-N6)-threonylcarbamoyltransferase complex dimerization subunit type 1 TsaB [Candidatus Limnocylindria bacterium]|nr:tRNA (adenosine(37)-N6)-threonylcarbamoyltransferase complex dimerization subunit type 1 TsaB [Candidatus Limnocylindria bacterium]